MVLRFVLLLGLAAALTGCGGRRDRSRDAEKAFTHTRADAVAVVVLDVSGSFEPLLFGRDNRAYAFLQKLVQEFFHKGIGYEQRLVVAAISGSDKVLLFDGTVRDFARRFPDAAGFKDHLKSLKPPPGSRVYDSVRDALTYTLTLPTVVKGHTRVGLFVLSDMDDNVRTPESFAQLEAGLKVLAGEYRGVAAFYYVDELLYTQVVALVRRSGFGDRGVVTTAVTASPPIPTLLR